MDERLGIFTSARNSSFKPLQQLFKGQTEQGLQLAPGKLWHDQAKKFPTEQFSETNKDVKKTVGSLVDSLMHYDATTQPQVTEVLVSLGLDVNEAHFFQAAVTKLSKTFNQDQHIAVATTGFFRNKKTEVPLTETRVDVMEEPPTSVSEALAAQFRRMLTNRFYVESFSDDVPAVFLWQSLLREEIQREFLARPAVLARCMDEIEKFHEQFGAQSEDLSAEQKRALTVTFWLYEMEINPELGGGVARLITFLNPEKKPVSNAFKKALEVIDSQPVVNPGEETFSSSVEGAAQPDRSLRLNDFESQVDAILRSTSLAAIVLSDEGYADVLSFTKIADELKKNGFGSITVDQVAQFYEANKETILVYLQNKGIKLHRVSEGIFYISTQSLEKKRQENSEQAINLVIEKLKGKTGDVIVLEIPNSELSMPTYILEALKAKVNIAWTVVVEKVARDGQLINIITFSKKK